MYFAILNDLKVRHLGISGTDAELLKIRLCAPNFSKLLIKIHFSRDNLFDDVVCKVVVIMFVT